MHLDVQTTFYLFVSESKLPSDFEHFVTDVKHHDYFSPKAWKCNKRLGLGTDIDGGSTGNEPTAAKSRSPCSPGPPVKPTKDNCEVRCDSVIARPGINNGQATQSHLEVVTFAPEQAYPEYILRFVEDMWDLD